MRQNTRHQHITEKYGTDAECISDRPWHTDSTVYRVNGRTRELLLKVFDHLASKILRAFPHLDNRTIRLTTQKILTAYRKDSLKVYRYLKQHPLVIPHTDVEGGCGAWA